MTAPRPDPPRGGRRRADAAKSNRAPRRSGRPTGGLLVGSGVVALLLALCVVGVQAVVMKSNEEAAESQRQAARYTPPPLPRPTADVSGSTVAVVGDQTVSRAGASVSPSERWGPLLEEGTDVELVTSTSVGGGFVARGRSGAFAELADDVPLGADVVVFFGGVADADQQPADVERAVATALDTARDRAPAARLVVVGPVQQGGVEELSFNRLRSTLQQGAAASGAAFVDPFAAEWLQLAARRGDSTEVLGVADERAIATRVEALLRTVLASG